jgi:hypothetical protein
MAKKYAIAAIVGALNVAFVACGGGGGGTGGEKTTTSTAHGGHGGQATTSVTGGSGGATTTSVSTGGSGGATTTSVSTGGTGTGGSTGSGGSTSTGGAGTGGDIGDAGADAPDVSFIYDADIGDGAVSADSACAADVNAGKKRPVDIIWVVDTSGSMSEEIAQIKANINAQFANILSASGLDYQVIMLADRGLGTYQVCAYPPLGGQNCGDNAPVFHAIDQTIASTNSLSLILSTYDSANAALNWAHLLRFNAVKVFIEVTDDNSSLTAANFETQLFNKLPTGMFGTITNRNYIFHSIIGVTAGNPTTKCPSAVNIGAQYQTLSNNTGGLMLPVCATDYSPIFQQIANGIVGSLACEFLMPTASGGAAIDPNNVSMQYTPSGGAAVTIPHVPDATQCSGDGWYYDDNLNPTKLLLCPTTCTTVQGAQGGKVDILVGCLTG